MALRPSPINWQIPIVDTQGRPTPEFLRQWQAQRDTNGTIPELSTPGQVSAVLDVLGSDRGDLLVRGASRWGVLAPAAAGRVLTANGVALEPSWQVPPAISTVLDGISNVQGSVLYRGAAGWAALGPGTAGQVLSTGGAGADPSWAAGGGGGGDSFSTSLVYTNTAASSSAFASKGMILDLRAGVTLKAVYVALSAPPNGSQYVVRICAISSGGVISSILATTSAITWTTGSPLYQNFPLSPAVTLVSGLYIVSVTYANAASGTTVLSLLSASSTISIPAWIGMPVTMINYGLGTLASLSPAVANTFTLTNPSASGYVMGLRWSL